MNKSIFSLEFLRGFQKDKIAFGSLSEYTAKRIRILNPNSFAQKIDLFTYNEQMDAKDALTGGNYKRIIRVFKNLRKSILMNKWMTAGQMNKYFIELIVYNIPNGLLCGKNVEKVFYKSLNFLLNCDVGKFKSFDDNPLDDFAFADINYANIRTFLNCISRLI